MARSADFARLLGEARAAGGEPSSSRGRMDIAQVRARVLMEHHHWQLGRGVHELVRALSAWVRCAQRVCVYARARRPQRA